MLNRTGESSGTTGDGDDKDGVKEAQAYYSTVDLKT